MLYAVCRNGLHPMTPENTLITTDNAKRCRACRKDQAAARKAREVSEMVDEEPTDIGPDYQLPVGTLGRKWTKDGWCRTDNGGMHPFFFQALLQDEACDFCQGCPVQDLCFAYAVIGKEQGVWGGTTDQQRQRLSLEERLTVRAGYTKLYEDYLRMTGDVEAPREASVPHYEPGREAIIARGVAAADYVEPLNKYDPRGFVK